MNTQVLNYIEDNYMIIYPSNTNNLIFNIYIDNNNERILNYFLKYNSKYFNNKINIINSSIKIKNQVYNKIVQLNDLEALKFLSKMYPNDKNNSDLFNEYKMIYNNQDKYISSDLFYL